MQKNLIGSDGSYTCLYHISTIGKYEIDIAMADNQNGLLGSYYRYVINKIDSVGEEIEYEKDAYIHLMWHSNMHKSFYLVVILTLEENLIYLE